MICFIFSLSSDSLSEKSQKQGKRFALNFTSSPLLGKKSSGSRKTEAKDVPQSSKSRNSQSASTANTSQASSSNVLRIGSAGNVSGSPSHMDENSPVISSRSRRQVEEYEKQRRALLGQGDLNRSRDKVITCTCLPFLFHFFLLFLFCKLTTNKMSGWGDFSFS